jgi:hypothetical protein
MIPKPVFTGDHLADLFVAHDRCSTELYDTFDQAAAKIDADVTLTDIGKARARRALVAEFRENADVKRHQANVAKGRERIKELTTELTAPKIPKDLSVYEQMMLADKHTRMIRSYESVPPSERHRVLRDAVQRRDLETLQAIYGAGILPEADARRVQAVLLEGADPAKFKQLVELAGQFDANGEHDPTTSAVLCASFAVDQLLEHCDSWAGLSREVEAARARFAEMLKTPGAPITLSSEEAHDAQIYRTARDVAASNGRVLSISGPEGEVEASMTPPASGGGNGAS